MNVRYLLTAVLLFGVPQAFADICSKVNQNQYAQLACPSGQVMQSISFASYGTPAGSCGSYKIKKCNANSSLNVVQTACVGKASCQVQAANNVFGGDPCAGTTKSLAIQAVCVATAPPPTTTTTSTTTTTTTTTAPPPPTTTTSTTTTTTTTTTLAPSAPTTTSPVGTIAPLPTLTGTLPASVASGTTLSLNCGTTYYGNLNLTSLSNVTIKTANMTSTCGRAVITPAVPVSGWTQYSGNIYVANVAQEVAQVFVDQKLVSIAHYPNTVDESTWVPATSVTATTITTAGLPNNDIVGARATYRGTWQWAIGSRIVTAFDGKTLTVPANTDSDLASEDSDLGKFYLEGKLWMLDSPGEWAWSAGKLYLWMPDGTAPGNRVLAAPNVNTIDAGFTTNVTIDNVRVFGGYIGINGVASQTMRVTNSEVTNNNWVGIHAKGSDSFTAINDDVINALHTGFYARSSVSNLTIDSSRFVNVDMVGMHKGSDGAIYTNAATTTITNNTILNCGKTGIFVGASTNGLVKGNTVNGACLIHGDCGGIYTFDRNQIPLNTRIEGNKVSNITGPAMRGMGPERYAIYLDDYSTGVTIIGNTVTNSATALLLHGAFNNTISGNTFSGNAQRHVALSESGTTAGGMTGNAFISNTFVGPVYAYEFYSTTMSITAGTYSGNIYQNYGTSPISNLSGIP